MNIFSNQALIFLILQYLLHMGLETTAANLREECRACDYPTPEEISGVRRCDITNLLQRFDDEDEAGFLRVKTVK